MNDKPNTPDRRPMHHDVAHLLQAMPLRDDAIIGLRADVQSMPVRSKSMHQVWNVGAQTVTLTTSASYPLYYVAPVTTVASPQILVKRPRSRWRRAH